MIRTFRGTVLDKTAHDQEYRIKKNRYERAILLTISANYNTLPHWSVEDRKDLGVWIWGSKIMVNIPWNPKRLKEMKDELEALGWEQTNTEKRAPTETSMALEFKHPNLQIEPTAERYSWVNTFIEIKISMDAVAEDDDGNLPVTQNCHLVEISRKLVPQDPEEEITYDVICDESYQELMKEVGVNGNQAETES